MKRLTLTVFTILLALIVTAQTKQLSLNGFTSLQIASVRSDFLKSNTNPPQPTSIWFSKDVIKNIIALLSSEHSPDGKFADGIRMYFGYLNGQITVVLISTYAFGSDPTAYSQTYHQDYLEHNSGDNLFKTANLNGIVCNKPLCGIGALLYTHCDDPCPDDQRCSLNGRHYIKRSFGEYLVHNFGPSVISTKCEWFDLDMFKAIDKENTYDGIRIYLGKHGVSDQNTDPTASNQECFVVVTTKGPNANSQTDYFDCDHAQDTFKAYLSIKREKLIRSKRSMKSTSLRKYNPFFEGQDNGEICPTHCPGTTP